MKEIPLTNGMAALVDDEEFDRLASFRWNALHSHRAWYAIRTAYQESAKRTIYMHCEIMQAKPGQRVDHKDGNGLNNQRRNLRFATNAQNKFNLWHSWAASGFKGVYWDPRDERWYARIFPAGKGVFLGRFDSVTAAADAYDAAALKYFGEFACTNAMIQKQKEIEACGPIPSQERSTSGIPVMSGGTPGYLLREKACL